jgi:hypothetical protein
MKHLSCPSNGHPTPTSDDVDPHQQQAAERMHGVGSRVVAIRADRFTSRLSRVDAPPNPFTKN